MKFHLQSEGVTLASFCSQLLAQCCARTLNVHDSAAHVVVESLNDCPTTKEGAVAVTNWPQSVRLAELELRIQIGTYGYKVGDRLVLALPTDIMPSRVIKHFESVGWTVAHEPVPDAAGQTIMHNFVLS